MGKVRILSYLLLLSNFSFGQGWPTVMRITDSAEYRAMEPMVDSCISYLHHTMPEDDFNGRIEAVEFLDKWISGVPYIVVVQRDYLLDATDRNLELTTQHIAGKLAFLRSNPGYPVNSFESELQGVLWMLELYETGMFESSDEMDQLIERRNRGTLEAWLRNELPKDWITHTEE